ncbi:hypothetical protein RRF57_004166 [Xylaria bambusicola]|uniref:Uncharacterized protein n=1 Tax=Xylaria bambusicola TaxID=326684 RepID=A0AAN7UNB1_9PEZI
MVFNYSWRGALAFSVAGSYLLALYQPAWWNLHFTGGFISLCLIQTFAWAVWTVILWPKLFSPLRSLPEPSGGSWWNGHFARILAEPSGIPMREW